jgi:hypothetical protein
LSASCPCWAAKALGRVTSTLSGGEARNLGGNYLLKPTLMISTPVLRQRHTRQMSNIDKQRIAAVEAMEALGYTFAGGEWVAPANATPSLIAEADALHSLLGLRADAIEGFTEGSEEEREFALIAGILPSGQRLAS